MLVPLLVPFGLLVVGFVLVLPEVPIEPDDPVPEVPLLVVPEVPAPMEPELPEVPLVSVPRLPLEPLLPTDASLPVELEPAPIEPEVEPVSVDPEVEPEPTEPEAVEPAVEPVPVVAEPLTPPGVVAVPVLDVSEPGIALLPAPVVPVALPVPVPVPDVPAVPALVPPVVPVAEPELPLPPPVCAVAPAAASATAERIVAASLPMLMNFLLVAGTVHTEAASVNPGNTLQRSTLSRAPGRTAEASAPARPAASPRREASTGLAGAAGRG